LRSKSQQKIKKIKRIKKIKKIKRIKEEEIEKNGQTTEPADNRINRPKKLTDIKN
jgi:hypothetical protein